MKARESSTIAAIATPAGSGGIGIIRISGRAALNILTSLFRFSGKHPNASQKPSPASFRSHRMHLGHIIDPRQDSAIDEVLAVAMKAPQSYTAEDVVEIQSHSGHIVLNNILELVLRQGAQLAEPGEFTRRAFMNGRIDLTQAESVIDIINARTRNSLDIAAGQLQGVLGKRINGIRSDLLALLAEIEAGIDFPEDVAGTPHLTDLSTALLKKVINPLKMLLEAYEGSHFFRDGMRMAVVGRPNVGKSSLLNRLIQKERAIVTEIPGTTRDTIEEMISINGLPVIIIDTAGLHETREKIEKMGIERTHQAITAADIVLFMIDLSQAVTQDDQIIYRRLRGKRHIIVMNKVDLTRDITLPAEWSESATIKISALKGTRIDLLRKMIYASGVNREDPPARWGVVPNLRQAECLKRAVAFAENAFREVQKNISLECVALDLKDAAGEVDQILGFNCNEDVLDLIFSRFCIGK